MPEGRRIEGAPAIIRSSQCPDIVLQITALRDMLDSDMLEDLMRAAASVRTEADLAAMRQLLLEVRANPALFTTKVLKENRAERRKREARHRRAGLM